MNETLQLLSIYVIAVELLFIAINAGYFHQKINKEILIKTLLMWAIAGAVLVVGSKIGIWARDIFTTQSIWYSATLLFVMAAKYLYVALRLKKARNNINPIDNQGMAVISFALIINALFLSASSGLYSGIMINAIWYIPTLIFPIAGLLYGIKTNKSNNFRYELIFTAILLLIAVIVMKG